MTGQVRRPNRCNRGGVCKKSLHAMQITRELQISTGSMCSEHRRREEHEDRCKRTRRVRRQAHGCREGAMLWKVVGIVTTRSLQQNSRDEHQEADPPTRSLRRSHETEIMTHRKTIDFFDCDNYTIQMVRESRGEDKFARSVSKTERGKPRIREKAIVPDGSTSTAQLWRIGWLWCWLKGTGGVIGNSTVQQWACASWS